MRWGQAQTLPKWCDLKAATLLRVMCVRVRRHSLLSCIMGGRMLRGEYADCQFLQMHGWS